MARDPGRRSIPAFIFVRFQFQKSDRVFEHGQRLCECFISSFRQKSHRAPQKEEEGIRWVNLQQTYPESETRNPNNIFSFKIACLLHRIKGRLDKIMLCQLSCHNLKPIYPKEVTARESCKL